MRARIERQPRIRFICGHDWASGYDVYAIGFLWKRNLEAQEGEIVYLKSFILHFRFRVWMEMR